jgi:hypothetical protein
VLGWFIGDYTSSIASSRTRKADGQPPQHWAERGI